MVGLRREAIYALVAQPCLQAGEQQGGILARPRVAEEVVTTGLGVDRLLGQQAQAGDLGAKRHRGKALACDQREAGFVVAGFAEHQHQRGVRRRRVLQHQRAQVHGGVTGLQPGCQAGEQAAGGKEQGVGVVGGHGQHEAVIEARRRHEPRPRIGELAAGAGQRTAGGLGLAAGEAGGRQAPDLAERVQAEHQQAGLAELRKQLARDRVKTQVGGFSALGLVEMTRKRTRESLAQLLSEPCGQCHGSGRVRTARTVAYDILREILREARQFNPKEFRIVATPAVVDMLLDEESQHLAGLSDFIGKPISLQAEGSVGPDQYDIVLL